MGVHSQRGLTLVELLVALAIFAIISAIAIPVYTGYSQRSYDREARADLLGCAMALERRAGINFDYGSTGGDWEDVDGLCDPATTRYDIEVNIPAGGATFQLRAEPISGSAVNDCPTITLDSTGQMSAVPTSGACS